MTFQRLILFVLISIISWSINPIPSIANRTPVQKEESVTPKKKKRQKKAKKKKHKKAYLKGNQSSFTNAPVIKFATLLLSIAGIFGLFFGYFTPIPIFLYITLGVLFLMSLYPLLGMMPNPTVMSILLPLFVIGLSLMVVLGFLNGISWLALIGLISLVALTAILGILLIIILLIFD